MKLFHALFRLFATLIAWMPFRLLYIKADFFHFIVYHIFRYRRKVVITNLKNAFPDKSQKEINTIASKFYKNLIDIFIEALKIPRLNDSIIKKRMRLLNPEVLQPIIENKKSFIVATGHIGNWEWLTVFLATQIPHRAMGAAKPVKNKFFDKTMQNLRSTFDFTPISFKNIYRTLLKSGDEPISCLMAADQTPTWSEINYWTTFLNQDTSFFTGIEKISKALDYSVIYFEMYRVKRGYYDIKVKIITEHPKAEKDYFIIENYINLLENTIKTYPDNWLWSHRRWKRQRTQKTLEQN